MTRGATAGDHHDQHDRPDSSSDGPSSQHSLVPLSRVRRFGGYFAIDAGLPPGPVTGSAEPRSAERSRCIDDAAANEDRGRAALIYLRGDDHVVPEAGRNDQAPRQPRRCRRRRRSPERRSDPSRTAPRTTADGAQDSRRPSLLKTASTTAFRGTRPPSRSDRRRTGTTPAGSRASRAQRASPHDPAIAGQDERPAPSAGRWPISTPRVGEAVPCLADPRSRRMLVPRAADRDEGSRRTTCGIGYMAGEPTWRTSSCGGDFRFHRRDGKPFTVAPAHADQPPLETEHRHAAVAVLGTGQQLDRGYAINVLLTQCLCATSRGARTPSPSTSAPHRRPLGGSP